MTASANLTAVPTIACSCASCQNACRHKPGWFAPGEAEAAATLLGVTLKELFRTRLMVDWLCSAGPEFSDVFLLSPAITPGQPGEEFGSEPRGRCTFLTGEGLCEIHAAKPLECRLYSCQVAGAEYHEPVGMTWNMPEHQQQVRDLLGREPESSPFWPFPFLTY